MARLIYGSHIEEHVKSLRSTDKLGACSDGSSPHVCVIDFIWNSIGRIFCVSSSFSNDTFLKNLVILLEKPLYSLQCETAGPELVDDLHYLSML